MRSVRIKFIAVILLCLLPVGVATRIFYHAAREEMRQDATDQMSRAQSSFSLELRDDIARLDVATRLIAHDSDVTIGLAKGDRASLHQNIEAFSDVYPSVRIYLANNSGEILATSFQKEASGSLVRMPEITAALEGKPFAGITRFVEHQIGPLGLDSDFSYLMVQPIYLSGNQIGVVLALFSLDSNYLDKAEKKVGLSISLKIGGKVVAFNKDHPNPNAEMPNGKVAIHSLPDGREVAMASFTPLSLGAMPGSVVVIAAKDITEQFKDEEKYVIYRLIALGIIAILALTASLFMANHIVDAIEKIAEVMPGVALKKYQTVEGIRTGDELQALAETYNHMIQQLREGERQREQLGKYLSRAARDAAERGRVDLGGTTMPATVLFSDIRGFTSLSEKMEPERVLVLLNRYFTEMVGAVVRHRGIVDKFMGDCIMAVWGPPVAQKDDALNAVLAALQMRERLALLNVALVAEGLPELRTGIGIHTGPVVAGNMGAAATADLEGKMEYTVIGDTVNLTSRLESLTKELHADVLLTEDTYRLVRDEIIAEPLEPIRVRGREQPVGIYRLIGRARVKAGAA